MKIMGKRWNPTRGYFDRVEVSIEEAVENSITSINDPNGAVEDARAVAYSAAKAVGVLVQQLHERGVLHHNDIDALVRYPYEVKE